MRSIKEVVAEYEEVSKDSALVPKEGYINVFVFKNQSKRDALRKEYISVLPLVKQLAVHIGNKRYNGCLEFSYEIDGIEDDWDGYYHKVAMERAEEMISAVKKSLSSVQYDAPLAWIVGMLKDVVTAENK